VECLEGRFGYAKKLLSWGARIDVIVPLLILAIVITLGIGSSLLDDDDFLHVTRPFLFHSLVCCTYVFIALFSLRQADSSLKRHLLAPLMATFGRLIAAQSTLAQAFGIL
jgi:hypothetical protein